jgi:catechol 2,3-dioxygenase-like lactoylglutathione lyase family enzyme
MDSGIVAPPGSDESIQADFEAALTSDELAALMRSTWTWDDRALRRDLSTLLVDLAAAQEAPPSHGIGATLRARSLASGARFVGTVLGPKLVADTGNRFRDQFVSAASDPAFFDRLASAGLAEVQSCATDYLSSLADTVDYPAESSWFALATERRAEGLAEAMRAYGNTLSSAPLLGNLALAWQALGALGTEGSDYAGQLERGEIRATLAAAEQSGSWDPALVRTRAQPATSGWLLKGAKQLVPDAAGADVIFTIARSVAGPSLFAVDATVQGLTITDLPVMDTTRPLFQVEFAGAPAVLLGREGDGGRLMVKVIDLAMSALAGVRVASLAAEVASESEDAAATLRRALSASLLLGGPVVSHDRLLERLGI